MDQRCFSRRLPPCFVGQGCIAEWQPQKHNARWRHDILAGVETTWGRASARTTSVPPSVEPILLARKGKDNVSPKPTCRNLKAPLLRNVLVSIHRGSRAAATIYADRGIPHHGNPPTPHMTKGIPSRQDGGQRVWTVLMREALIRRAAVTDVPRLAVSRAYRFTSISVVLTAGSCRKKEPALATPATELTADHWYGLARDRDGSMPSILRPFCVACVAGGSRCWDRVAASTI